MSELESENHRRVGDRVGVESMPVGWGFELENWAIYLRLISSAPGSTFKLRSEDLEKTALHVDAISQAESPDNSRILIDFRHPSATWKQVLEYLCLDEIAVLKLGDDGQSYIKLAEGLGSYSKMEFASLVCAVSIQMNDGIGCGIHRKPA